MKKLKWLLFILVFLLSACKHLEMYDEPNFQSPVLKFQPKLYYPNKAQEMNRSGLSTILITITKEGTVKETTLLKTSGHKDLDRAAENYCKNLIFHPATRNGYPITTKMRWQIRFDLKNLASNMKSKIKEVMSLYNSLKKDNEEKITIQNEILNIHNTVIGKIKDVEILNHYMYNVIQDTIIENWQNVSNDFPLSFLLYHDFIIRFGDYEYIDRVKSLLKEAVESELNYLNTTENLQLQFSVDRKVLVKKIETFIKNNYS